MKILLVCNAGMSTSVLVKKMQDIATKKAIEVEIEAIPEPTLKDKLETGEKLDCILIGPQIAFQINEIKELCNPYNIPVECIDMRDYGTMNGEKVLDFALNIIQK